MARIRSDAAASRGDDGDGVHWIKAKTHSPKRGQDRDGKQQSLLERGVDRSRQLCFLLVLIRGSHIFRHVRVKGRLIDAADYFGASENRPMFHNDSRHNTSAIIGLSHTPILRSDQMNHAGKKRIYTK